MPRPGPRSYECVRRDWHSDRHQPIRGSIIQLIFRVVTEAHSSTTRKNREWQEKLPRVVLKAEEIMYSKANSEAEYVDADTLWDRLNVAINTIIRRDESTETGQFLQPCIEAALVLGCVPVRASRSQRHINTRSYLNPRFQEPAQASPRISDKVGNHGPFPQPSTPSGHQLSTPRSAMANQASSFSLCSSQMGPNANYIANQTSPQYQQSFPRPMLSVATESKSSLNLRSIYPLYYGSHFPNVESPLQFHSAQISNVDNIIIGRPIGRPSARPTCFSSMSSLPTGESIRVTGFKIDQVSPVVSRRKAVEMDCDLSLRLGPSDCSINSERYLACVSNASGSSSHQEIYKYAEPCAKNLELSFFPRHNASDPFEYCDNRLEQEVLHKNETLRKRKAGYHELGDGNAQWMSNLQHNQHDGQSRRPVLDTGRLLLAMPQGTTSFVVVVVIILWALI